MLYFVGSFHWIENNSIRVALSIARSSIPLHHSSILLGTIWEFHCKRYTRVVGRRCLCRWCCIPKIEKRNATPTIARMISEHNRNCLISSSLGFIWIACATPGSKIYRLTWIWLADHISNLMASEWKYFPIITMLNAYLCVRVCLILTLSGPLPSLLSLSHSFSQR